MSVNGSTNSYYTHSTGVPAQGSRGLSPNVRAEYDSIATAFAEIQNQLGTTTATSNINFPVTPTSITPGTSDNSTNIATTAFVVTAIANAATIGALTSTTSSPNKIPLADGAGHINLNWLNLTFSTTAGNAFVPQAKADGTIDYSYLGQASQLAMQSFYNS